jgi:DNA-binding LacI/PurR family transcriptional regulator
MAATIDDVAAVSGVSRSTVSRVFVNPGRVSRSARAAVLSAAEELGYVPNRVARSDAPGKSGALGVIVPDLTNPFFPHAAATFIESARRRNYLVYLADPDLNGEDEYELALSMSKQVDGILLWAPGLRVEQLEQVRSKVPIVVVNRLVRGFPTVLSSGDEGVRSTVEHLHALGHRRCCYVQSQRTSWTTERRHQAMQQSAEDLGMEVIELGPYDALFDAGVQAADVALVRGATALIAQNDMVALGAIRQLAKRDVRIPAQMSVTGVDDSVIASTCTPALTTVHLPIAEIAALSIGMLIEHIKDPDTDRDKTIEVPSHLIVRDSTGPAPGSLTR